MHVAESVQLQSQIDQRSKAQKDARACSEGNTKQAIGL
jgi:hypothetical protein